MNYDSYGTTTNLPGGLPGGILAAIIVLGIWSAVWKGFALYRAGSLRNVGWFTALFLLNTAGILEILYLFIFSKRNRTADAAD
ncbi:MAG: DUF5652 family protein [Agromyces sp.]